MGKKNKRLKGFLDDVPEWWEKHWQDMPEYISEDKTAFKSITVHFVNKQNMEEFAELINQKIGFKTKYVWYPKAEIETMMDKIYVEIKDES